VKPGARARARRRAALALACCLGAVAVAACGDQAHVNSIISALRLHRAAGSSLYETRRGCRIEVLLGSWTAVKVYWDDQKKSVYTNAPRTLGVKAVQLSPSCETYVEAHLRLLNPRGHRA
jgi:putative component of toxin-antitoxin plasmid stabilization module